MTCLLLTSVVGCSNSGADASAKNTRPMVKTELVKKHTFGETLQLSASIEAWKVATLAPSLPVRVRDVRVRIADEVKQGDTLVVLEATAFHQGRRQANAGLDMARTQLRQAEAAEARFRGLRDANAVTASEYEQVEAGLELARSQVAQARAGVGAASDQLRNTRLIAPFDGVIIARNVEPGELVSGGPGQGPPIQIADMSKLRVVSQVGELHASRITQGQEVEVRVSAVPGRTYTAVVSRVSPAIDPRSRTVRFEALLTDGDDALKHGMAGHLRIEDVGVSQLAVPRQAVLDRDDGTGRVVVLNGDRVEFHEVKYGTSTTDWVPVFSGVQENDVVLTAGHTRLQNDEQVAVVGVEQ